MTNNKQIKGVLEPILPLHEMLKEQRGGNTPTLDKIGWSGK